MPSLARSKESKGKERKNRIIVLGIVLASIAVMGGIVYFVYSSALQPYRAAFELNMIIGNPNNNQTKFVRIPSGIGVNSTYWAAHYLDQFGVSGRAPIYTLDDTGIVRVQSTVRYNYTLGDFFNIWGRFLNSTCVQVDQLYCDSVKNHMFLSFLVKHESDSTFTLNSAYDQYLLQDQDSIRIAYLQLP